MKGQPSPELKDREEKIKQPELFRFEKMTKDYDFPYPYQ